MSTTVRNWLLGIAGTVVAAVIIGVGSFTVARVNEINANKAAISILELKLDTSVAQIEKDIQEGAAQDAALAATVRRLEIAVGKLEVLIERAETNNRPAH